MAARILPRMSTTFSMLQIMNAALISQGQDEILSENDGSVEWRLLSRNWPTIVEAELEDGNYHFTRRQDFLQNRAAGKYGFDDAYLIPLDVLHVRRLWTEGQDGARIEPDWSSDGSYVYVDEPAGVFVESVIADEPDLWGPNFCRGVQMKLEAVILRALKEEAGEAQQMEQQAEVYFQRARTRSSQQRKPQPAFRRGPIASARFAGRYRTRGFDGAG